MSDGGKRNVRARGARSTPLPIGPALRGLIVSFLQHRGVMAMVDSGMLAVEDLDSAQREAVRASLGLREQYQQNIAAAFGPLPPHLRDHVTSFYDIDMARNQQRTGVLTGLEPDMVRASAATRHNGNGLRPMHLEIKTTVDADVVDIDTSRVTALTTRLMTFRAPIDDLRITHLTLIYDSHNTSEFFSRFPNVKELTVKYSGDADKVIDLAVFPKLRKLKVDGSRLRVNLPQGNRLDSIYSVHTKFVFPDDGCPSLRELSLMYSDESTIHLPLFRKLDFFHFQGDGLVMDVLHATKVSVMTYADFELRFTAPRVRDLTLRVSGYPPPLSAFPNVKTLELQYGDIDISNLPHLRKLRIDSQFPQLGGGLGALEELSVGYVRRRQDVAAVDLTRYPRLRVLELGSDGVIARGSPTVEELKCTFPIPEGFTGVKKLYVSGFFTPGVGLPHDMRALDPDRSDPRLRGAIVAHLARTRV